MDILWNSHDRKVTSGMNQQVLIENATVVTMNAARAIEENCSVLISGDTIQAMGPAEEICREPTSVTRVDGNGKILMPGLINAHTHIALSLLKGIALGIPDGLYRVMWPVERIRSASDCYIGALAGAAEALKGGSTTIVDRYFFQEQAALAATQVGIRGFMGHSIISHSGPIYGQTEFDQALEFVKRWKDRSPLITPNLAPHATDTVDCEWLIKIREIADREGVGIQLHVAQTQNEKEIIEKQYGKGCVQYLHEIGFLRSDVLCAHSIFLNDEEIDLFAQTGAHPVYCPMGHALTGQVARAWEMVEKGVAVLIGTDCVTVNTVMDLLGELKIAGASQKQMYKSPAAMPSQKLLEMVTVDAAKAIGMEGKLGVVAPGYYADLILVDISHLQAAPKYEILDTIVYGCSGRDVHTVIVNGEIVVENHTLKKVDENELITVAEQSGRELISRATCNNPELRWLWERVNKRASETPQGQSSQTSFDI